MSENNKEPRHHAGYRRAWLEYRQALDTLDRQRLEREMDAWQNHFAFAEFQSFKATLPGYAEMWGSFEREGQEKLAAFVAKMKEQR